MKAAVVEQFGEPMVVHADWAEPECGPRDAVIRVEACGICRSDHTIWEGGLPWMGIVPELPAVLGHEYCGVVEELGSEVTGWSPPSITAAAPASTARRGIRTSAAT
jgi:D-arabinose 1-dehydrogenase-like Zn-dependent alcohol dehydrogenase